MEQFSELINEARLFWHVLVSTEERLIAGLPVTLAMRAVLEFLKADGPTAVPGIARRRRVTRQHIQVIVNDLLKHGLVTTQKNPAHKRSTLIALTQQGRTMIAEIRGREEAFLGGRSFGVTTGDLKRARKTLRTVRRGLEAGSKS